SIRRPADAAEAGGRFDDARLLAVSQRPHPQLAGPATTAAATTASAATGCRPLVVGWPVAAGCWLLDVRTNAARDPSGETTMFDSTCGVVQSALAELP